MADGRRGGGHSGGMVKADMSKTLLRRGCRIASPVVFYADEARRNEMVAARDFSIALLNFARHRQPRPARCPA
jgi:hypothetical protein